MANIVSINVTSRSVGQEGFIQNFFFGTKNAYNYSPAVVRGFDTGDFVGPITNNGSITAFTTRDQSNIDNQSRKDYHIDWTTSDTLAAIQAQSSDLIILTGLFRDEIRQVPLNSQKMIFDVNKMVTGSALIPDPVSGGTIFNYVEEGNNLPMQYTVAETIAYIAANSAPIPHSFNGYEYYVNDIIGNDSTAQAGDPLSPWLTFDAAMAAAALNINGVATVIVTGDINTSTVNAFVPYVNIEVRAAAKLYISNYTASGNGDQIIFGEGLIQFSNTNGLYADATYTGKITVDIGTFVANNTYGSLNASTVPGVIFISCDYSVMSTTCKYLYAVTGTAKAGGFETRVNHLDNSTQRVSTFFLNPGSLTAGNKYFIFYLARGKSFSSNEGLLTIANTDNTYYINAEFYMEYNGNNGSPGLNALLSCWNCTGGNITLKGTNLLLTQARHAIILNSAVTVYDYSNSYQQSANMVPTYEIGGGTSLYTVYGKHLSLSQTSGINLGVGFTSTSATTDFGTPIVAAGGTDTLHFKGSLKCTYANNAVIGITVGGTNPNLVLDGGIIEMTNSNTPNKSLYASGATNMKVLGQTLVRGDISGLTNIVTGTNIIQDTNVVAVI
jgi:hypothetical protein